MPSANQKMEDFSKIFHEKFGFNEKSPTFAIPFDKQVDKMLGSYNG